MQPPAVSIVIPTFNSAAYVVDCLESVLAQSFSNFEAIVIDDGSDDETVSVVKAFSDPRIKLIELPENIGPAGSRNAGIHRASGRFLAFLDSDDVWHPRKLEIQLAAMLQGGHDFTYTLYDIIDQDGRPYARSGSLPYLATYADLLPHCFIRTSSIIYDTLATSGKIYCPDIRKRQDFGLFLSILKRVSSAHLIDQVLCSYRVRENSVSSNKLLNIGYQWQVLYEIERLGLGPSSYYMVHWLIRSGSVAAYRRWRKALSTLARRHAWG
ncbi:MAG TPA: glycosyltransferase family 2 protein [Geminicoccus sp.]|jgi:glycosyltransferase involved in cell wall biosynthesis|uniref:glycosyltransferase family 2 protein n=1 Tax=Geminicoccus sp. TaxID=2024832 RepID=UPI002E32F390|nr:glycosyltransferase family 2 protein [Geminicoccus sp.]HEX2527420.1 glycosyltransferase family 2 protein [Geminicoccus sp.]